MGCLNTKAQTTDQKAAAVGSNGVTGKGKGSNGPDGQNDKTLADLDKVVGPGSINITFYESIGLSTRQVFSLKQSWKGIKRKMEDTGVDMFVRLFKTNTELKRMFHKFKELNTDDELRSNEALEYHATMVMTTLDDTITHIDNYDFIRQLLTKTGASHFRFQGFEPKTFLNIKQPFLDAVQVTLGDRYTENMENIYKIAINFIIDTLMEGLQEEIDKNNDGNEAKAASS